jgi:hypothetical protein
VPGGTVRSAARGIASARYAIRFRVVDTRAGQFGVGFMEGYWLTPDSWQAVDANTWRQWGQIAGQGAGIVSNWWW